MMRSVNFGDECFYRRRLRAFKLPRWMRGSASRRGHTSGPAGRCPRTKPLLTWPKRFVLRALTHSPNQGPITHACTTTGSFLLTSQLWPESRWTLDDTSVSRPTLPVIIIAYGGG
ncbi:hypothetical protein BU26DRAFT_251060 [Trematosphaeria pertusa]|uniref:Uncharacterized protein n=1 Tax=Trematosphaeria pertusa TaxID=390896 RepID=A0A6A6IQP6_9PLEO|nr:uncharacterized protein BU26DRAFT_251060 [Trematosphaeria pertusa]KAF2252112.1 hypothetical protein BU26DRAFT_251060 [Trematosphaeria pertusa]